MSAEGPVAGVSTKYLQEPFLECEKGNSKLLNFYLRNGFVLFGERVSDDDGVTYLQLFQFLK